MTDEFSILFWRNALVFKEEIIKADNFLGKCTFSLEGTPPSLTQRMAFLRRWMEGLFSPP